MLGILIGLLPIGLGIKAFTRDGLPLTRSKNIKGSGAKAVGVICILVGVTFIAEGIFSAWLFFRKSQLPAVGQPLGPNASSLGVSSQAWVTHECPQGGYSVLMPGTPSEEESPGNPVIGLLGAHMSIVEKDDGRAYMAKCSRFSVGRTDVKKELDAARDNIVTMLGGTLQVQKDMQLAENPGREVVVSLPDNTVMRTRYFLAGKNLFQVLASVPKGQEWSNEANEFFNSFHLLSGKTQEPATAWARYDSKHGGFSVRMPGAPKQETMPVNAKSAKIGGVKLESRVDDISYTVESSEYFREQTNVKQQLDEICDKLVAVPGRTLAWRKEVKLAEHPGLDMSINLPNARTMRARFFYAGRHVFQILAFAPHGRESSSEINEFFNSFHLLPSETKAWPTHDCPEGGFSVQMPVTPDEKQLPANAASGQIGGHDIGVRLGHDSYSVSMFEYSSEPADIKKELDGFARDAAAATKGTLEGVVEMTLEGHSGQELLLSLSGSRMMRVRSFFAGNRRYQISAVVPQGDESSIQTNEFFNSFHLMPEP